MEKQSFIDRILETENLTDELEDADANWLIEWGIQQLDSVLAFASDEEEAGGRVNALMAVMRKMNRIAGNYTGKDPRDLAADLAALVDLFCAAYNGIDPRQAAAIAAGEDFASRLAQLPTRQALEALTRGSAGID